MLKLDSTLKRIEKEGFKIPKRNKNLHSQIHWLADEVSNFFKEPKKFAMYLGIIKRIGFDKSYQIFHEIKESNAKEPRKLFMWKMRKTQINTGGNTNGHK
jgi:hypothetical protein